MLQRVPEVSGWLRRYLPLRVEVYAHYVAKIAPRPLAAWRAGPAGTAADYRREVAFDGEDLIV